MGCCESVPAGAVAEPANINISLTPKKRPPSRWSPVVNPELKDMLASLTTGQQQAECCICFDLLCEAGELSAFTMNGKRTCAHFFHRDCCQDIIDNRDQALCPLCRRQVDDKVAVPDVSADPDGWFACIDHEGDGQLSHPQVLQILVSQFPVDPSKLDEAMPKLWERWDVSGSGKITKDDFLDPKNGLLAFVRAELLHEPIPPSAPNSPVTPNVANQTSLPSSRGSRASTASSVDEDAWETDPKMWFTIYDENGTGFLTFDQLVRALVRSNRRLSLEGARRSIAQANLAQEGEGENISLARFLRIHETLKLTANANASVGLDNVMAIIEAMLGEGHNITRDRAAEVLAEENGSVSRTVNRLQALRWGGPDAA